MLNEQLISNIRESGMAQGTKQVAERDRLVREEFGFRSTDKAEYALIIGCFNPWLEPEDLKAFRKLLDHFEVDYSLLPKEYCCGSLLHHQAIDAKSDDDLRQADQLAQEFFQNNLNQAREIGASKILAYCNACEASFKRFQHNIPEEIVWYSTLLQQLFVRGRLDIHAHYYAGCHHYKHSMNSLPDLSAALTVLDRIEGLELDHLNSELCCLDSVQLGLLADTVNHDIIITPCGGCALALRKALKDKGDYQIMAPPTAVWAAVSGKG